MSDPVDPPRKFYQFKPKAFESVNGVQRDDLANDKQPAPDPGITHNKNARIDVRDLLRAAEAGTAPHRASPATPPRLPPPVSASGQGERIDVHELNRAATAGRSTFLSKPPAAADNEIHGVLRENLAKANAAGLNEVTLRQRRPSRRKRDYLLAMVFGNLALLVGTFVNPVFGIAGLIIFNLGITWIMWFIMDDY